MLLLPGFASVRSKLSSQLVPEGTCSETMHGAKHPRWQVYVLVAIMAWAATLIVSVRLWPRTLDDAWITYRYGLNLATGHGLQWNALDPAPYEGYTSLTHVLLSGLFIVLHLDPVMWSKITGVLSNLAILCIFACYAQRRQLHLGALLFAASGMAANVLFGFHAVSGMETLLFALVLTACSCLLLLSLADERYTASLFLTLVLAVLTRPEAVVLAGLYYLILIAFQLNQPGPRKRTVRRLLAQTAAFLVLPGLLYAGFKLLYFGTLLPSTFSYKVGSYANELPGIFATIDFLRIYAVVPAVALATLFFARKTRTSELATMAAIVVAILFYVSTRQKVAVGYRFFVPYLPSMFLVVMPPLSRLFDSVAMATRPRLSATSIVLTGLLWITGLGAVEASRAASFSRARYSILVALAVFAVLAALEGLCLSGVLDRLWQRAQKAREGLRRSGAPFSLVLGSALVLLAVSASALCAVGDFRTVYGYMIPRAVNPALGRALAGLDDPQHIVLATGDAGAIPYYSGMYHLDFLGLVSREGTASPTDPSWVFNYSIDILVTHSIVADGAPGKGYTVDAQQLSIWLDSQENRTDALSYRIVTDPRLADFDLVAKIPSGPNPGPSGYYYVFVRRGFSHYAEVCQRMGGLSVGLQY